MALGGNRSNTTPGDGNHDPSACIGVHPAALLNALAAEARRYPDIETISGVRRTKRRAGAAEMVALRAQGWTVKRIAERFDITPAAMSQRLLRAGQRWRA